MAWPTVGEDNGEMAKVTAMVTAINARLEACVSELADALDVNFTTQKTPQEKWATLLKVARFELNHTGHTSDEALARCTTDVSNALGGVIMTQEFRTPEQTWERMMDIVQRLPSPWRENDV